jgi:peptidoglycan hydrolase-like protein with peptidoglycan-binding domain
MNGLPLVPGAKGSLVRKMQLALIKKGYSVGPKGANGNFDPDTLVALEAFQDNDALPVQPKCDDQCWQALGLAVAQ